MIEEHVTVINYNGKNNNSVHCRLCEASRNNYISSLLIYYDSVLSYINTQ